MLAQLFNRLKWFKKKLRWNYKYKKGKWDFMANEDLRYNTIVKYIKNTNLSKPSILDLGCGYGALNDFLKPDDYGSCLGVDISSVAVVRANSRNFVNSEFIAKDIHQFFPHQKFDVIIFNEVLYYLDNQLDVVERFATYLNPNGYFIFSFYGIREDLIHEIEKRYTLIQKEIISQSESVLWGICLYKV